LNTKVSQGNVATLLRCGVIFDQFITQSLLSLAMKKKLQEAQLMLTNPRDAFGGQSRSPNMAPFDLLVMVSY